MGSSTSNRRKVWFPIVALLLILWGAAGFINRLDSGWGAFTYSPDYVVNLVEPDGAADEAGLQMGDRIVSVEGIPVEDLPLYSRWPRSLNARAHDIRRFVVERQGELATVEVVYAARGVNLLQLGAALIGLAFMAFGLWPLFTVDTCHARTLGSIGLTAGFTTFGGGGPYLGTWDGLSSHVQAASMMLFVILLLRFFLAFPQPNRLSRSRLFTGLLFAPWVLFIICLILELIFHPKLYHTFGGPASLVNLVYLLLAVVALICSVITQRRNLGPTGLGLVLIGILVAVVPTIVAMLGFTLRWGLPGSNYYALALVAFPLFLALAVRKQAQAAQPS